MKAQVMRRAWELAKAGQINFGGSVKMYFAESLRMAWKESKGGMKETKEEMIARLEGLGFKRWTNYGKDRMYINATQLGFEYSCYNTGNIKSAYWQGERISNTLGRSYKFAKTYLDLDTMKMVSDRDDLKEAAIELAKIA